ncbi:GNAT family N-acetyltransferase [Chitinophaga sp. HK235]|uniref:GNAT family N-acetyltransferase n=1 Tax=Chitinophaga sp. HK235 TaxID=2952571 RepID=UPI001BA5ECCB|nr:GNAT family N-acetyltransferase [Chitinophaga sp. HK235]
MMSSPENIIPQLVTELLGQEASMPYDLLLLADPSIDMINTYISGSYVYIALLEKARVGVYVLLPLDNEKVEVKNIAVHEAWQGRGIGKYLLQDAAVKARSLGFTTLVIGTGNSSVAQLYLYQRSGFDITAIHRNFFIEHYTTPIYENGIQCKHMIMLEKPL